MSEKQKLIRAEVSGKLLLQIKAVIPANIVSCVVKKVSFLASPVATRLSCGAWQRIARQDSTVQTLKAQLGGSQRGCDRPSGQESSVIGSDGDAMWKRSYWELARERSPVRSGKSDALLGQSSRAATQSSGNATPCNSFNANTGGGVTALDAQTHHRISIVAVQPPKNCEKISERH